MVRQGLFLAWSVSVGAFALNGANWNRRHPSTLRVSASAAGNEKIINLNKWAQECGIKVSGLEVKEIENAGFGFVSAGSRQSNDLLITVPNNVVLSVESPGDGPDDGAVIRDALTDPNALRDVPWFAQFSVYLNILDKVSSIRSDGLDMRPWLEVLPRTFDTPIHWGDALRKELQYDHLETCVSRQETEWKELFQRVQKMLTSMTLDDFVWGCECARSRVFSGAFSGSAFNPSIYAFTLLLVLVYLGLGLGTLEQAANGAALVLCGSILKDFVLPKLVSSDKKKYVLCPMMDLCNHDGKDSRGHVAFEFFGNAFSLAATQNVSGGSQVTISYGARSNDQLLQYYGFVEEHNPHDVYVMPPLREWNIQALEQACGRTFSSGRLGKIQRAGLLGSVDGAGNNPRGGVVLSRDQNDVCTVDPAVMQALRALTSTDQEWSEAGASVGTFANVFSQQNERLARLAAKTALEMEWSQKPTTLEQDETALRQATTQTQRLAIRFRMEKKKLLLETINQLSD